MTRRIIQLYRGTTAQNDAFTGEAGELSMDTDKKTVRIHDGSTQGGHELVSVSKLNSGITNCITEIPQDIKLELNAGTLTLKAGSKVYVPNGFEQDGTTPHFDTVTIANDLTTTGIMGVTGKAGVYYNTNGLHHLQWSSTVTKSGSSVPASFTGIFYNTTTNKMSRYYLGSIEEDNLSLPLCVVNQATESTITSIDQVFNGLGYIGSTVFALPGLKGLIPDGRNADGTLKNIEITVNTVQTLTPTQSLSTAVAVILEPQTQQLSYCGDAIYNEAENLTYDSTTKRPYCQIGSARLQASKITAFIPKQVFHSVDYYSADFVIAERIPTSDNNYTWYRKYKSGWVEMGGRTSNFTNTSAGTGDGKIVTLPVPMKDNKYTVVISLGVDASLGNGSAAGYSNRKIAATPSTTTLNVEEYNDGQADGTSVIAFWKVSGYIV